MEAPNHVTADRADVVDAAIWQWIKDKLSTPWRLAKELEDYQEQQERRNAPLREQLEIVDGLKTGHALCDALAKEIGYNEQLENLSSVLKDGTDIMRMMGIVLSWRELRTVRVSREMHGLMKEELRELRSMVREYQRGTAFDDAIENTVDRIRDTYLEAAE